MTSLSLYEIIERSARAALGLQAKNGAMPSGHNGPHGDEETPVRNTAHWIITFLKSYEISKDDRYLEAAQRACDYLASKESRPMNASFWCRQNPVKDFCNGLVGQAWVIESLAAASEALNRPELYALAEEVFMLHPWDESLAAWYRVNVDGSINGFDRTFNHQLWFAAAASLLTGTPEAVRRSERFTSRLTTNLRLYKNGVIKHINHAFLASDPIRTAIATLRYRHNKADMYVRSVGYHGFNLYALSMLRESHPGEPFWKSSTMRRAIDCISRPDFLKTLDQSKYGYPYNPPGIEMGYALQTFRGHSDSDIEAWLNEHFLITFNHESQLMDKGSADPATSAARIYEATRLKNYTVSMGNSS